MTKPVWKSEEKVNGHRILMADQDFLKSRYNYDPETGIFTHTAKPTSARRAGKPVRNVFNTGRAMLSLGGHLFQQSRAAWLYVTGENPIAIVEHINGDCADNRWVNLRLATQSQNCANRKVRSDNKLGVKGVTVQTVDKHGNILGYQVQAGGKYVGYFNDIEQAKAAYADEIIRAFGQFARTA